MKKNLRVLLIAVLLVALAAGGFAWHRISSRIGRDAAMQIALADAGLEKSDVRDIDIEYDGGSYEVEFEAGGLDYHYVIGARNGSIFSAQTNR